MKKSTHRVHTAGKVAQQEQFLSRNILPVALVSVAPNHHEPHRSQIF